MIQTSDKEKTNMKYLSRVLGHQEAPQQLQCTLALILQVSELPHLDDCGEECCLKQISQRCSAGLRSGDREGHSK